jgi:hypothetical protein
MRTVTVYRVDYVKKTRVPIGGVRERRRKDRGGNLLGLLRLARKTYGTSPEDAIHIAVDNREARGHGCLQTPSSPIRERNIHQRIEGYSSGTGVQTRPPPVVGYVTV